MSLTSLYAGVSGLNVNGDAISVIGNNISNSNTIGFKSGRVQFQDIVSKSLGGGAASSQIGRGAHTGNISTLFTQSSFETTSRTTDLAIDGEGFFIVNDNGINYYTRAGDFIFDKDGFMVNSSDLRVQGWTVDENGSTIGDITDINIADVSSSSKATTEVSIGANLDSTAETKFVINDNNNQLVIGGVTDPIVFNSGTYTGETLAAAMQEKIRTALANNDFDVSYSNVTGKFTFSNNTGSDVVFDVNNTGTTIKELIGLPVEDRTDPPDGTPDNITITDGTNVISETPRLTDKLFYINNNNNTIIFTEGGVDFQAVIPVQPTPYNSLKYDNAGTIEDDPDSMAAALETALNNAEDTAGGGTNPTNGYTVNYDDATGKFTISSDNAGAVDVTFNWADDRTSAEQLLGFASEYDTDNTLTVDSFTISGAGYIESVYSPNTVFDPTAATYSTALNVYDTLGSPHTVSLYFKKVSSNNWEWYATMSSEDLDNGIPNSDGTSQPMMVGGGGMLEFNPNGSLKEVTGNNDVYFNFAGGADLLQPIDIDFGTSTTEGGSGLDGTTQYANASATFSQGQDGFPAGALSGVSVGRDGLISGVFSNGEIKPLAQLALAMFQSPWGLTKEGNNLWAETVESGEQSNVDIATEFVRMISAQRAYQANARMITTSDELLTEVVNLKR
jgi:flagellar hook protein FlgE